MDSTDVSANIFDDTMAPEVSEGKHYVPLSSSQSRLEVTWAKMGKVLLARTEKVIEDRKDCGPRQQIEWVNALHLAGIDLEMTSRRTSLQKRIFHFATPSLTSVRVSLKVGKVQNVVSDISIDPRRSLRIVK